MKLPVSREYWPTTDWKEETPQDMGMNPSLLARMHEAIEADFASGFGGQLIYVIPALDLIVTTTASMENSHNEHEQWEMIQQLIPHFILPAIIEGKHR